MTQSTNAILAFGFDLGEELPDAFVDDEGFDFEAWAEKQAGMEWTPNDEGYFKRRDAMLADLPVKIETHCSADSPMYFLALNGMGTLAHRGYPQAVEMPAPTVEQIDAMLSFCEKHGIDWQEPKWHIFSYWG